MADGPITEDQLLQSVVCTTTEEFYADRARDAIGRMLRDYLETNRLTPIELLHGPRHQLALANAGTTLTQAVQKAASAQVRGSSRPVTERIKEFYVLSDAIRAETKATLEKTPAPVIDPSAFPALVTGLTDRRDFQTFAALSLHLDTVKTWSEKITMTLALAAPGIDETSLDYLDRLLAELLRSPAATNDLLGPVRRLEERIQQFIGLVRDGAGDLKRAGRATSISGTSSSVERLTVLMATRAMQACRDVFRGHIHRELASFTALAGQAPDVEFGALVRLRRALADGSEMIGGDTTRELIERRMNRAVSPETLAILVDPKIGLHSRIDRTLALIEDTIGENPRTTLIQHLEYLFEDRGLEREMFPTQGDGLKRLRAVGQILRRVRLSNLPKGKRERLGEKLTKIMAEELRKHDVFRLVEAIEDPTQRALELLDLMAYPALTTRLAQAEARKRAMGYMRRPEFLTDLLAGSIDDGEKARRLIDLRRRLADAGISD